MAEAAVFFVIIVPSAGEEHRLKTEYIARKLDTPVTDSTATVAVSSDSENQRTPVSERDNLSLQTLKLACEQVEKSEVPNAQYDTHPVRRNSVPEIKVRMANDDDAIPPASSAAKRKKSLEEGLRVMMSAAKCKTPNYEKNDNDLDLPIDTAMEVVLREILKKFQISNVLWTADISGCMYQVSFTVEFNEIYENLYHKLHEWGIGEREGSTVSVMNCVASNTANKRELESSTDDYSKENITAQKQGAWDRFMNSVRARLNVAQIVRDVRHDAAITFDFVILLISAAVLASFGLVEDSTIFLASSMLISPLMGPIIAAIFGTVIKERSLRSIGMRNELIGILMATFVGFLFGLVICTTDERYGIGEGLTEEMLSRCDLHSLVVGVFTAVPSGAAAAIGILGGNVGSLVGVAISASLLPPAVNSGLLWALACIYKLFQNDDTRYLYVVKSNRYSNNQATELAILGSISMCLTISNVLCVYIMGILVLKVKEIAPIIARNNSRFWKHDIKIARDLNRNGRGSSADDGIIGQFANLAKEDQHALGIINYDFLRKLDAVTYQNTWSPLSARHTFETETERDSYSTIHRLEQLYTTITNPQNTLNKHLSRRPSERLGGEVNNSNAYKHLAKNRPRFATMPTNTTLTVTNVPEIVIDVCPPSGRNDTVRETIAKRFTVTPADAEDPLLK